MVPKLRIVNKTGKSEDTHIFRIDTDEDITDLMRPFKIDIEMRAGELVVCNLSIHMVEVDVKSDVPSLTVFNPVTREYEKVHKVEFESGDYLDWHGLMKIGQG